MADPTVTVTQVRSAIGAKPAQRGTLRALGLRRIGATRVHTDSPSLRGQLNKVAHLVEVVEGADEETS